jgi:hypothetical protein
MDEDKGARRLQKILKRAQHLESRAPYTKGFPTPASQIRAETDELHRALAAHRDSADQGNVLLSELKLQFSPDVFRDVMTISVGRFCRWNEAVRLGRSCDSICVCSFFGCSASDSRQRLIEISIDSTGLKSPLAPSGIAHR